MKEIYDVKTERKSEGKKKGKRRDEASKWVYVHTCNNVDELVLGMMHCVRPTALRALGFTADGTRSGDCKRYKAVGLVEGWAVVRSEINVCAERGTAVSAAEAPRWKAMRRRVSSAVVCCDSSPFTAREMKSSNVLVSGPLVKNVNETETKEN